MTDPSIAKRSAVSLSRRWCAGAVAAAGSAVLLLSICLRNPYLELGRLIVGGLIAPATVAMAWMAASGGILLGLAPVIGGWRPRARSIALVIGAIGLLLGLLGVAGLLAGPRSTTVRYTSGDIQVEGTLRLPDGKGPFPAVVVVHGSAPFRRGFYAQWADSLVGRGIAVLVPDKRGVGGSGGVLETGNNAARTYLDLLASDIVSGVRFLRMQPMIAPDRIGLLGISQGGWVGPLAASQDSSIAFLVLLSGPATSTGEEGTWSELRGDHDGSAVMTLSAANDSLVRTAPRGYDPRPVVAALGMPSLWLFGEADNSVPTVKSVVALDSLARAGAPVQTRVFPGADHVMIRHDGPLGLLYTDPGSWQVWLNWVQRVVSRRADGG